MEDIENSHSLAAADRTEERQWRKLRRLLRLAYDRVPFYQNRFRSIGAEPEDIKTPQDFERFPILSRKDILDHVGELLAYPREKLIRGCTSGSTSRTLMIYTKKSDRGYRHAAWRRAEGWIGANFLWPSCEIGISSVTSNVPEKFGRWRRFIQPHYRYSFQPLTLEDVERLLRDLAIIRPRRVHAFPSYLRPLAQAMLERGIALEPAPLVLTGVGELCSEEEQRIIEKGFGAPYYDFYASRENTMMAAQCRSRQGYHVLTGHVYLEILQHNGCPAPPDRPGRVVVTDLDSLGMLYVRYENEDIAAWSGRQCACGRTEPILEKIHGRFLDTLIDRNGAVCLGSSTIKPLRAVLDENHVRQFQFRQTLAGRLEILTVPGLLWAPGDGRQIAAVLEQELGGNMEIVVHNVDRIDPEPSGKTRLVIGMG